MTAADREPGALIRFLAAFCREHPLDEKMLVVPAFIVGRQIGEALARRAGSWVNLRFVTPSILAAEVLERSGGAGESRPLSSSSELALTDRLVRTLVSEGKLGYLGRAGASPGLVHALYRAVRDLRLNGRTSTDIRPERFLVADKGRELALLLERYEHALAEDGLCDRPAVLGRAAREAAKTAPWAAWTLALQDVRLSRLEADLVRAVGGDRLVLVPGDPVFGLERPRHFWPAEEVENGLEAGPLSWLFAPGRAPAADPEGGLDIFRALGPANECREILRRLYDDGTPFDQVEVLTPPGSAHATVFHLLSTRTGLPVTFGDGVPVSFTSPGRLFFGLADWLAGDFSSDLLGRLVERGDLILPAGRTGPPASRTACRNLRAALIGWGRDRYLPRLRALREGRQEDLAARGAEDAGGRRAAGQAALAEIDELAAAMGRLLDLIPKAGAGGAYDFQALCGAFARVLREHGRAETDLDRKAREALLVRLAEILAESRFPPLALHEALGLIRAAGTSLRVGASPPLPARLHIASFSSGGYSGRPVTFVAGLDEAAFPGRGLQDPVLLDEERRAVSDSLPTAADDLRSNLFGLAAKLASLRGRVVFSYPSFDVVEGRESFPSSVVLQAFRLRRGDPGLDYAALERGLPEAAGYLPGRTERAFDDLEWWLDRLAAADPRPDGPRTIAANFAGLASGLAAAAARDGDKLTAYEGLVDIGPLRADVDPLAGKAVMSATRLELLARCPFAYFLRHVLKVEPPEEAAFDRSRWLDPLQRGSLVHEILCEFMAEVERAGDTVSSARHGEAMARIAAGLVARTRERVPPPSEAVFESERRDLLETLEIFLAAEEKREDKGRPFAFEKEIRREEIGLGGGRSFRLNGFIDRVDELGRDLYRIIDYKTGSPAPYEDLVEFGRGRTLQPALYAVCLEQVLARERPGTAPRVAASGYLFPSRRGEGHEIMLRSFDRDRLRRLLSDLLGLIGKGIFIAGPEAKCEFCDYSGVCASGGSDRAGRKREANPDIFEAYDRLDEYK